MRSINHCCACLHSPAINCSIRSELCTRVSFGCSLFAQSASKGFFEFKEYLKEHLVKRYEEDQKWPVNLDDFQSFFSSKLVFTNDKDIDRLGVQVAIRPWGPYELYLTNRR